MSSPAEIAASLNSAQRVAFAEIVAGQPQAIPGWMNSPYFPSLARMGLIQPKRGTKVTDLGRAVAAELEKQDA